MKNKKFGFEFWKGIAEVVSYAFIGIQLTLDKHNFGASGVFVITGFFLTMMIISEYKNDK